MILADTAVWIDHFRSENAEMRRQLSKRNIVLHPYIIAELAMGSLRERAKTLAWLDGVPQAPVARLDEVRRMIEAHSLYCRGVGLIEAHLLASCLIHPPTLLWTNDRRLTEIAGTLGVDAGIA